MNKIVEANISDIKIGERHRKEMGDLEGLAKSIHEVGLLQPIGITKHNELVFGERRLRVSRDLMKLETIPARIVDVQSVLHGEFAENMMRKEFTICERVAIVDALRSFKHGGNRRSEQNRNSDVETLTVDEAAKRAGLGGKDGYNRAKKVVDRGVPELVAAMDEGDIAISAAAKLADADPDMQLGCLKHRAKITAREIDRRLHRARRKKEIGAQHASISQNQHDELGPATLPMTQVKVNSVTEGDCRDLIPFLPDESINLGLCSPPYADQRKGLYPGVSESEYPDFTVDWMSKLWDKLTDDGSVLIVIDPAVKRGVVSDYVMKTRLALREYGWKEHQPQIWLKRDRGALGRNDWPRHCYEQILWFSKSSHPFCDPKACGTPSNRVGAPSFRCSNSNSGGSPDKQGIARVPDVWNVPVGNNGNGVDHPAMFPLALPKKLIPTFCPPGGTVLDNFSGSGSTLIAAKQLGYQFYGLETVPEFVKLAQDRLAKVQLSTASRAG